MSRVALLLLAVACGPRSPTTTPTAPARARTPPSPEAGFDLSCELTPETIACRATNRRDDVAVVCASPYVGVTRTGALLMPISRSCSRALQPGETGGFEAELRRFWRQGRLIRPADVCGPKLAGCVLRVFDREAMPHAGKPSGDRVPELLAFARELERGATERGTASPTLAECGALRERWLADPRIPEKHRGFFEAADSFALLCIQLVRADFDCMARETTEAEIEACLERAGASEK